MVLPRIQIGVGCMKKSDAAKHIFKYLKLIENCEPQLSDAMRIIDELEDLGMLPPFDPTCDSGSIMAGEAQYWEEETPCGAV